MQVYIKCVFLDFMNQETKDEDVSVKIMTYRSNHEIQGRFRFYDNEAHLRRDWKQQARANIRQKTFLEGILLKSLDPDNPFPYVDYAVFCTSLAANTSNSNNNIPQQHSNKPMMFRNCRKPTTSTQNGPARLTGAEAPRSLRCTLPHSSLIPLQLHSHAAVSPARDSLEPIAIVGEIRRHSADQSSLVLNSAPQKAIHTPGESSPCITKNNGFYDELEYILRNEVKPLPRTPVSQDSVYFLSVFQTDGHISRLEETWKTWSGADFILWKCPEKLKLRRVTFFKSTNDTDIYTFIVLCECEDGLSICDVAREFVERLKDRRCGLVGLYQVERYYIASKQR